VLVLDYAAWRLLHFAGIFLTFLSLGGTLLHALNGGTRENNASRRWMAIGHGVGLLLVLLGGFGMLGVNKMGFPGWVHPKLLVWVLIAAALPIAQRKPGSAKLLWFLVPVLGLLAAWFGGNHT
jgi:hypothetical protein